MSQLTGSVTPPWHALTAEEVTGLLEVDPRVGLSSVQAARRLERHGPNQLAEAPREPRWRAFLRQFQDLLILILLVAAVVSLVVTREWETPVAIAWWCCSTRPSASSRSRGRRRRWMRCGG